MAEFSIARTLPVALVVAVLAAAAPSKAEPAELILDNLSFFYFEGAQVGEVLPAGARIPMTLSRRDATSWRVTIDSKSLAFPPVRYPSGKTVRWKLGGAASGILTTSEGRGRLEIDVPLVAYVDGAAGGFPFPLRFSTEVMTSSAKGIVAERQGARFDPSTGLIQLVATGVSPLGAPTAPGKPFYVVLSGQLGGVPPDALAP